MATAKKSSPISLLGVCAIGFLMLGVAILSTLEFVGRRTTSQLNTAVKAQAVELAELKARVDSGDSATAGQPSPGEGGERQVADDKDEQVGVGTADILKTLELLSSERAYVVGEIKQLRERISRLAARVDHLSRSAEGPSAPSAQASRLKQGKLQPPRFVIAWSAEEAHSGSISSLRIAPDNRRLATAGLDNAVRLWDIAGGGTPITLSGHSKGVTSIGYSPDGLWLASSSRDRTIKMWHVASGAQVRTLMGHRGEVDHIGFVDGGRALLSSGSDSDLNLWSSQTGARLRQVADLPQRANAAAYSPRHPVIAFGFQDTIELWNPDSGVRIAGLPGHSGTVTALSFSRHGALVASGSEDGSGRIWSVAERKLLKEFQGHQAAINDVAFSPDGRLLATASNDGQLWLWLVEDGRVLQKLPGHDAGAYAVTFSEDGRWLASADGRHTLHVWRSGSADDVAAKR